MIFPTTPLASKVGFGSSGGGAVRALCTSAAPSIDVSPASGSSSVRWKAAGEGAPLRSGMAARSCSSSPVGAAEESWLPSWAGSTSRVGSATVRGRVAMVESSASVAGSASKGLAVAGI